MRVAALYDVHGNLPALEAVLADVERHDVDQLVFGGDLIWGPFPSETIDVVRGLGDRAIVIAGNSEREVVDRLDLREDLPSHLVAPVRWTAERLSEEQLAFVRRLAKAVELDVDTLGTTLFCHASPRSDDELLTKETPAGPFAKAFAGIPQEVVVCGHTHMQYHRRSFRRRVVNPGSVGLPYERRRGAYWALLGPTVVLRRTSYDVERAVEQIRATGFPMQTYVDALLSPPPQKEMIERFEAKRQSSTSP
jgi:predicted phosphodiesterase